MILPFFHKKKLLKKHRKLEDERAAHEASYEMLKMRGYGKSKGAIGLLEHILYCKQRSRHFLNQSKIKRRLQ
jgi:hypothetical protein